MTVYLASWYLPVKLLRAVKVSQPQLCIQPVVKCGNPGPTMQLSISEQNTYCVMDFIISKGPGGVQNFKSKG